MPKPATAVLRQDCCLLLEHVTCDPFIALLLLSCNKAALRSGPVYSIIWNVFVRLVHMRDLFEFLMKHRKNFWYEYVLGRGSRISHEMGCPLAGRKNCLQNSLCIEASLCILHWHLQSFFLNSLAEWVHASKRQITKRTFQQSMIWEEIIT